MTSQTSPWHEAVVYQVYPWTFQEDSHRHPQQGNGTLSGITERLSYLNEELGVDTLWLSPFYPSAMKDAGYDISDYQNIHPSLGTLDDFDTLVAELHNRNMRLMIDYVPNHTSDQHEWFQRSRNREEGFEDWYIWHPGKTDDQGNRIPPNNWPSVFSIPNKEARQRGEMPNLRPEEWTPPISAWQWDDQRGEYYMRTFAKEQPDLNWSNPQVREAMKDIMRWWLDRGVDGFRIDAINHIGKNMELTDEPVNTAYNEGFENPYDQLLKFNSANFAEAMHKYIWEMCEVLRDEQYQARDLRLILEAYLGQSELREINDIAPDVATTFNFGAMLLGWEANSRKIQTDYYYENLPELTVGNQVNGNHDRPRLATRLDDTQARAAAVMNLFLPGMRFVYNGEELGFHDASLSKEQMRDKNGYRDNTRTPFLWDDAQLNAGFSKADPAALWLPINEADLQLAASKQHDGTKNSLALYRAAIRLNRELPALQHGHYVPLKTDNEWIFAYGRKSGEDEVIVAINFSPYVQHTDLIGNDFASAKTILSSIDVEQDLRELNVEAGIHLQPNEALVIVPNRKPFALWM